MTVAYFISERGTAPFLASELVDIVGAFIDDVANAYDEDPYDLDPVAYNCPCDPCAMRRAELELDLAIDRKRKAKALQEFRALCDKLNIKWNVAVL